MKNKRAFHKEVITKFNKQKENKPLEKFDNKEESTLIGSNEEEIRDTFDNIILPKKRKIGDLYKKEKKFKDNNYIPYSSEDKFTEEG